MKKRLLILGMIFTMAVSSAGCGSSSSDNAGKTEQPKQTATVQDSQKDTSNDSKSDNDKKDTKYKTADEITMDDLMSHDETPADDFELIDNSDEIVIEKYVGKDPIVVIPDEIDGKKVVGFSFMNDKNIVAVRIGDNITEIDRHAFGNAENSAAPILQQRALHLSATAMSACSKAFANSSLISTELCSANIL